MNANLAALLYLVSGILFILALRGLSSPATSRQGNRFGMIGMAIAVLTTLALASAVERPFVAAGHPRLRHRRRHRRVARAHHPDDRDAAARGDVPFAGRPRRGARRRRRVLCARGLRHRRGRHHSSGEHDRDVAWARDRRDDLHRLDHRLPQARRPHVRRADPVAPAPRRQRRARRRARPDDRAVLRHPIAGVLLAHRARSRSRSASCSSFRSAAPTCRSSSRCSTPIPAGRRRASASPSAISRSSSPARWSAPRARSCPTSCARA